MLFLANFDHPPPVTLCHTPRDARPPKVHHASRAPRFLTGQKPSVQIFRGILCAGVLSGGLLSGRFCPGCFLSVPPSVRINPLQMTHLFPLTPLPCITSYLVQHECGYLVLKYKSRL